MLARIFKNELFSNLYFIYVTHLIKNIVLVWCAVINPVYCASGRLYTDVCVQRFSENCIQRFSTANHGQLLQE